MKKLLSFVIPCYRSELTIKKVVEEIIAVVSERSNYDYEIICVNDASPDNVQEVLHSVSKDNIKIKVIQFVRNFGKHSAVLAGYKYVQGEYVVNLDDDFQCPVYELWKLIDVLEHNDNMDVATARYYKKEQALWKNVGSYTNNLISSWLLNKPKAVKTENFSVIRKFVVDEMRKYSGSYPYLGGLIWRVTHNIVQIDMEERNRGDNKATGFTFIKSLSLFVNGLTAFSIKPLRIITFGGFIIALGSFIYGIWLIYRKIAFAEVPLGYTSVMVTQLFLDGILMIGLGLMGEYVGRIYILLNKNPQYVIRKTINIDEK